MRFITCHNQKVKTVDYSDEFKQKIKRAFPAFSQIHQLVEDGKGEIVGRYLNNSLPSSEAVELARLVINPEKTSEANALAVHIILKKSLYSDWLAIAAKDLK